MSRIFDALRRSEKQLQQNPRVSPQAFIETMEKTHASLKQVLTEQVRLRPENRVVVYNEPKSLGAERYRLLRTRLRQWRAVRKVRTILLTSACPQEGKSVSALNLATTLAARDEGRVLLLEGDLRRSSLRAQLGLSPEPGLSDCLGSGANPMSVIRRIEPLGFYLLSAGQAVANPVELLQSDAFPKVIRTLMPLFDWVLIDSPPVTPLADTLILKTQADSSLVIVRGGQTPREAVEEAVQLLGLDHVIGLVLNGAEDLDRSYRHYYRYHDGKAEQNGSGKRAKKTGSSKEVGK